MKKLVMNDEIGDAEEWVRSADESGSSSRIKNSLRELRDSYGSTMDKKEEQKEKPVGQPTQYSHYRDGFTHATQTFEKLPNGIYDITNDSNAVYVVPSPPPGGLLLELPEMKSEDVIVAVERFWGSEKDYKEGNEFVNGGALFKSGIMIYGPPGSGKSCTIKIVSKKLVEKGGTVFFSSCHPAVTMGWLNQFRKIEPNRKAIVILEDIDSLIASYSESYYLEMLDSAKTIDNVLFIATTNYPERLDPRIYNRPGRFSHVIKIGMPTAAAREAFLKAILKSHKDVDQIVKETNGFSVDHLTALINSVYREKKELNNEIKRLKTLFEIKSSEEERRKVGFGAEMNNED